jgi:hypothetical protein
MKEIYYVYGLMVMQVEKPLDVLPTSWRLRKEGG